MRRAAPEPFDDFSDVILQTRCLFAHMTVTPRIEPALHHVLAASRRVLLESRIQLRHNRRGGDVFHGLGEEYARCATSPGVELGVDGVEGLNELGVVIKPELGVFEQILGFEVVERPRPERPSVLHQPPDDHVAFQGPLPAIRLTPLDPFARFPVLLETHQALLEARSRRPLGAARQAAHLATLPHRLAAPGERGADVSLEQERCVAKPIFLLGGLDPPLEMSRLDLQSSREDSWFLDLVQEDAVPEERARVLPQLEVDL